VADSQPAFRFGVGPGGLKPVDQGEWRDLALRAEAYGYSTLSVSDHLSHYGPFAAMSVAAGATSTLRLGTLVLCNDLYHPAVLAREAITLDALSGGRVELGLGAGWMSSDYDAISLPFDPPSVRISRLREAVGIIRTLLRGETCSSIGDFYRVDGLRIETAGTQAGSIPLLLAGSGDKMLTLAGEEADIVGVNVNLGGGSWSNDVWKSASAQSTAMKLRTLDRSSASREVAPERQIVSHFTRVTEDRTAVLELLARQWNLPLAEVADSPHALVGTVDQIVDQLERLRQQDSFSYITVDATVMDEFAPVVRQLAGQ
jgi:probable F420-dependent oxidoreductase